MDDAELKSILTNELTTALGQDGGLLSTQRRDALRFYNGEPFGDLAPIEGRSSVVMRSVMEAIEWSMPAILRCFCSSDKLVEFEPTLPENAPFADQATSYVNWIIGRDNNSFMLLYTWFHDALTQKVGYIKCFYDTEKVSSVSTYSGLTDDEYQMLVNTPDSEIVSENAYPNPDPGFLAFSEDSPHADPSAFPGAPPAPPPMLHDLVLRTYRQQGRVRLVNVPPEEILVSRRAPSTVLDGKHYCCHRSLRTVSDLRQMGYDEELIQQAKGYQDDDWNSERINRFLDTDEWPLTDERTDEAMVECMIEENYIRVDYLGTGTAQLRKIVTAGRGTVIFDNVEIDDVPILSITPIPQPHKHHGLAITDLVSDVQTIKSIICRQILDNAYLTNSPRIVVSDMAAGPDTFDDLLNVRPGGIVRVTSTEGIEPLSTPFVAGQMFPVLEYLDATAEIRTGISRHNQGLDPDSLNKTATGISLIQQAASQRVELIARIFAEMGIKQLAKRVLGLVIKHQDEARIIRLDGKFVPMDPRTWNTEFQVNINVGLGTGNHDQILGHLMQILQVQQQIVMVQKGVSGPLVNAQNIYDVLSKMTENAGFREKFFSDPSTAPPQPPGQGQPPNPEMMKAQQAIQADNARNQADMQSDQQKAQLTLQLEQIKANHQMSLAQQKQEFELKLEQMREQGRLALAQAQAQLAVRDPGVKAVL